MTEEEFNALADGSWKYEIESLRAELEAVKKERDELLTIAYMSGSADAKKELRELEPVAWMDVDGCLISDTTHPQNYTPLYSLDGLK